VIPYLDLHRADAEKVKDLTRKLLRNEEDDSHELKRLHSLLHDVKDTTPWDLIVGLMRCDTDKHIAMLEFVLRH
jgi:bacterioferritin (cytochrome b1)